MRWDLLQPIQDRLAAEKGAIHKTADLRIALTYPSPYRVGMSSLGFQTLYRILNDQPGVCAERAFLPDDVERWRALRQPLVTYETQTPVGEMPVIALSVAYELEIGGVVDVLELAGLPALAEERDERHPLVIAGGPLTFSNPLPVGPFVDAVVMGEGEGVLLELLEIFADGALSRRARLERMAALPHVWVPAVHGERLLPVAKAPEHLVPAYSQIITADTELSEMFLIEAERGCSRGCTFCVMRRSTNGGMRLNDIDSVLSRIPDYAPRVGLVGAAVTDHPNHLDLVRAIVDSGRGIGISSLRADKITGELTGLLKRGGYRTMTVASDGASERIRLYLRRRIKEEHLLSAARHAADAGLQGLKVYMMIGVPGERDDDIDELIRFTKELSKILPVTLGMSPFVPKRNTPLHGLGFTDVKVTEARVGRIERGIRPRAKVKSTSPKWAWVEYRLAQGGMEAGRAAMEAHKAGGRFGDWKRAFAEVPVEAPWTRPGVEEAPFHIDRLDVRALEEIQAAVAELALTPPS